MPAKPWCQREGLALLTDLYELTMVAGFWKERRADQRVCFEYFFRRLPPNAGFAVAAGLGPFLQYLENLRFSDEDIAYLDTLGLFDEAFLEFDAEVSDHIVHQLLRERASNRPKLCGSHIRDTWVTLTT